MRTISILLFFVLSKIVWTSEPYFNTRIDYPVGLNPTSVAAGDFDNDGNIDLASANRWSNNITVLFNNGNGQFNDTINYGLPGRPLFIACDDLDLDNDIDLAVPIEDSTYVILLKNSGSGIFNSLQKININKDISWPGNLKIEDINNDQNPDIILLNRYYDELTLILNEGNSIYQNIQNFEVGNGPLSLEISDINSDSKPDILTANEFSYDVSLLINNGDNGFFPASHYSTFYSPNPAKPVDYDQDGDIDILTSHSKWGNYLMIIENNGNGSFQPYQIKNTDFSAGEIFFYDIDLDGFKDLLALNNSEYINADVLNIYRNLGGGNFSDSPVYIFSTGDIPRPIIWEDLDNDSFKDIIIPNFISSNISVVKSNMDGSYFKLKKYGDLSHAMGIACPDVNNDNLPDVAVLDHSLDQVVFFKNDGVGGFYYYDQYTVGENPRTIKKADLNFDSLDDVIVANEYSENISVLLNTGNGFTVSEYDVGDNCHSVFIADLDGDESFEILAAADYYIAVLSNTGNYSYYVSDTLNFGENCQDVVVADLNNDQWLDIMSANWSSDNISILLNQGGGIFNQPVHYFTGSGYYPNTIAVADLNDDEYEDLIVSNYGPGSIAVFINTGDGSMSTPVFIERDDAFRVAALDLDHDGKKEIIQVNPHFNSFTVSKNFIINRFEYAITYGSGNAPLYVDGADFDGDGDVDLVTSNAWYGFTLFDNQLFINEIGKQKSTFQPENIYFSQNYPNPFNNSTNISFNLPAAGHISLCIYTVSGQKVMDLINENLSAGSHRITWNGQNKESDYVSSGVYFYTIIYNNTHRIHKKMLLLR